ncbi:hypothetical protein IW261DRAFT_1649370 [Armillaria novae-zelandiae]|uniref:RRM domain-containing protein n=1 Tax=Armillaria novae-zelandiae TaxID=153914 RepID=A0AA39NZ28_9AGAR|nr:hypothetical protein IW261DRAFT_1649370 [Armillaria novae-zelandiae]
MSTSSFMSSDTATGGNWTPAPSDQSVGGDTYEDSKNVYINGLPPNYPEDQLFNLGVRFGTVRSVRSFTRQVGDKESGYGFILFETIDAAETCIRFMRRSRNLHATFSKKVYKIPGTTYTQAPSISSRHSASSEDHGDDSAFKAKMERLHDPNSTTLYIEGLPLSIDESSLLALVSPHKIKSSKLLQTKLVMRTFRLDTRVGAEEVIERLHGRIMRGWSDPGSRISVRFADTYEQRELRRSESSAKENDQSPWKSTIHQAAPMNLQGRGQLLSQRTQAPLTVGGSRVHPSPSGIDYDQTPFVNRPFRDFASNTAIPSGFDCRGNVIPIVYDPPLASSTRPMGAHDLHQSPYDQLSSAAQSQELAALINTPRSNGSYNGTDDWFADGLAHHRNIPEVTGFTSVLGDVDIDLGYDNYHPVSGGGNSQARNGFTSYQSPRTMNSSLPTLQEEFSSSARKQGQNSLRRQYQNGITHQYNVNGSRLPGDRDADQIHSHISLSSQNSSHVSSQVSNSNQHYNRGAHLRSSILPHSNSTSCAEQHHFHHDQYSSMSIPKSKNTCSEILHATAQRVQQHRPEKYIGSVNSENNILSDGKGLFNTESDTCDLKYNTSNSAMLHHHRSNIQARDDFMNNCDGHAYPHSVFPDPDRGVYDVEQLSLPLGSPALIYSTRGSGATLSPTAPFGGLLSQQQGLSSEGA